MKKNTTNLTERVRVKRPERRQMEWRPLALDQLLAIGWALLLVAAMFVCMIATAFGMLLVGEATGLWFIPM